MLKREHNLHYRDIEKLQPVKIECRKEWHRRIPNVVHYVWFGDDKMNMMEYFAARCAFRSLKSLCKLF